MRHEIKGRYRSPACAASPSHSLFACKSVSVSLSVYQFPCLRNLPASAKFLIPSIAHCFCLHAFLSVFFYSSVSSPMYVVVSLYVSVCLSICLSVYLPVCLYVCLSLTLCLCLSLLSHYISLNLNHYTPTHAGI